MSSNLESLVQQAPFIFLGTVEKLNAAAMPGVPAVDGLAIVKVDELLRAPPALKGFEGKAITVRLKRAGSARAGEKAVFFTTSWIYGKGLAVVEVGRTEPREPAALQKEIAQAIQKGQDKALQTRLAKAELVVRGKVTATKRHAGRARLRSEHDPDWWEADLAVRSVLKGKLRGNTLRVLYPNSKDEMWIDAPKFHAGEEGIWILQKDQKEKGPPRMRVPGYTALDPLDFQPQQQLQRIQRLLQSGR